MARSLCEESGATEHWEPVGEMEKKPLPVLCAMDMTLELITKGCNDIKFLPFSFPNPVGGSLEMKMEDGVGSWQNDRPRGFSHQGFRGDILNAVAAAAAAAAAASGVVL
ncbi:hypothetical protein BN1723_003510 [Verticillium longisporum]|uniref:Uncharacterized protein n=1 Tax=Verticillium longisporum TaxID=100787 RepID=A0A0G4LDG0_VERLO|nr:hypothetical protein BN1708_000400 [Verticillium longisporum]CRK28391.1 hypothetical protein BN1723_003510 [Verticillium longisporum]